MKLWYGHVVLGGIWLLLMNYVRDRSYMDPSSIFYNGVRAYTPVYSAYRENEARAYLGRMSESEKNAFRAADATSKASARKGIEVPGSEVICLGIPSVRREREQFLGPTVASLMDGITLDERRDIHLVVLLADEKLADNAANGQLWLENLADEVLVYGEPSAADLARNYRKVSWDLKSHDRGFGRNERVQLDYASLIEACQRVDAAHFVLIEDDVIASKDWHSRLRQSLSEAEAKYDVGGWMYVRLFYSETYMGWNSEEWPVYVRNVFGIYFAIIGLTLFLRSCYGSSRKRGYSMGLRSIIRTNAQYLVYITFWMSAFVALYFMSGRLLVNPYEPGVQEMPHYGCCAQGLAFPRPHLEMLRRKLVESPFDDPGDSFIEKVADEQGLRKLAMVPSVLQHVGIRGSSDAGIFKDTWNFWFERHPIPRMQ